MILGLLQKPLKIKIDENSIETKVLFNIPEIYK
jgi:hypothetical protein